MASWVGCKAEKAVTYRGHHLGHMLFDVVLFRRPDDLQQRNHFILTQVPATSAHGYNGYVATEACKVELQLVRTTDVFWTSDTNPT